MTTPPSRSLTECLGRAWQATRANLPLIPLLALQNFLVSLLLVLSFVPVVLVLGGGVPPGIDWADPDPMAVERWIEEMGRQAGSHLPALALALLAATVIGLIAVVLWAFFQAGTVGILATADRQAPPAATTVAAAAGTQRWIFFRTFSWREFAGWGNQYLWRFFGYFHLLMLIALGLTGAFLAVLLLAGLLTESVGGAAALAVGCVGVAVFALVGLLYGLWAVAVHPYLVELGDPLAASAPARRSRGGLGSAAARGWRLLRRRFGAVLGIALVVFVAVVVFLLPLLVLQTAVELLVPSGVVLGLAGLAFLILQTLASSSASVFLLAALVALARGEAPRSAP